MLKTNQNPDLALEKVCCRLANKRMNLRNWIRERLICLRTNSGRKVEWPFTAMGCAPQQLVWVFPPWHDVPLPVARVAPWLTACLVMRQEKSPLE